MGNSENSLNMEALFGSKLLSASGEVSTTEALSGKKAIALYFSAHWCPPCRGFTPQFAKWYEDDLKGKGLEVVFVSSDQDEASFKEYFGEMPWLALPYGDERKETLSKQFKVRGIPSVAIVDPEGNTITCDGRAAISADPTGEEMPWKPKSLQEILAGAKLLGQGGEELVAETALADKVYAFYFSAHWCPPCRGFTPQFAKWYTDDLKAKGLEVVFVSSDRDEGAFKEYFGEQPWLALDYSDRKRKEQLSNLFGVQGIPSVVIIDKDVSTISKDGRGSIASDPTGAEFPWYPKPVKDLKGGPGNINEVPTVIALCETNDAAAQQAAYAAMEPLATKYLEEAKAAGEEDPKVAFTMATEGGGIGDRLREMFKLPSLEGGTLPAKLMLCDIPDEGGYYEGPEGPVTAESVAKFVEDWTNKTLERKQLG